MINLRQFRKTHRPVQLELIPFIDVIFTLLIFFGVTSTLMMNQKAMDLTLPSATTASASVQGTTIRITEKQQFFFNDEEVASTDIREMVVAATEASPTVNFVLQADRTTPYETIVYVMDAIRAGGGSNIMLDTARVSGSPTQNAK